MVFQWKIIIEAIPPAERRLASASTHRYLHCLWSRDRTCRRTWPSLVQAFLSRLQIDFSERYYNAGVGAAVNDGSGIATPDDLKGKVVGVQIGTSGERLVR